MQSKLCKVATYKEEKRSLNLLPNSVNAKSRSSSMWRKNRYERWLVITGHMTTGKPSCDFYKIFLRRHNVMLYSESLSRDAKHTVWLGGLQIKVRRLHEIGLTDQENAKPFIHDITYVVSTGNPRTFCISYQCYNACPHYVIVNIYVLSNHMCTVYEGPWHIYLICKMEQNLLYRGNNYSSYLFLLFFIIPSE